MLQPFLELDASGTPAPARQSEVLHFADCTSTNVRGSSSSTCSPDDDLQFLHDDGVSHGQFNLTTLTTWRWLKSQAVNRAVNKSRPEDACQESMRTLSRA
jgi:hypothetical protein